MTSKEILTDTLSVKPFGNLPDGKEVKEYTLTNINGYEVKVINYGGIITSLYMPDKNGVKEDIVLGFDNLEQYLKSNPYFGSLVGRYGNRIAKGKFTLDGKVFSLSLNNGENHLHGGFKGFDKVVWDIEPLEVKDGAAIVLKYTSHDMEEGYPGTLLCKVIYQLTSDNQLKINYEATTDQKTIVNLTQHTYFNLTAGKQDVLSHILQINANEYLPVDSTLIPTGELRSVTNTPFDFRDAHSIGSTIYENDEQLKVGKGYDHCWVLDQKNKNAAILFEPLSGRTVTVITDQPGMQVYTGNFLDGSLVGKNNIVYDFRTGICLETQCFPDSPNKPGFPNVVLDVGEVYRSQTIYKFSVK